MTSVERSWTVDGDSVVITNQKGIVEKKIFIGNSAKALELTEALSYEYNFGKSRGIAETKDKLAEKLASLVMGLEL